MLFRNGIYNFSFGYNHSKSKELECKAKSYDIPNMPNVLYKFVQTKMDEQAIYRKNLNITTNYDINIEFKKKDISRPIATETEYKINRANNNEFTFHNEMGMEVA